MASRLFCFFALVAPPLCHCQNNGGGLLNIFRTDGESIHTQVLSSVSCSECTSGEDHDGDIMCTYCRGTLSNSSETIFELMANLNQLEEYRDDATDFCICHWRTSGLNTSNLVDASVRNRLEDCADFTGFEAYNNPPSCNENFGEENSSQTVIIVAIVASIVCSSCIVAIGVYCTVKSRKAKLDESEASKTPKEEETGVEVLEAAVEESQQYNRNSQKNVVNNNLPSTQQNPHELKYAMPTSLARNANASGIPLEIAFDADRTDDDLSYLDDDERERRVAIEAEEDDIVTVQ